MGSVLSSKNQEPPAFATRTFMMTQCRQNTDRLHVADCRYSNRGSLPFLFK